MATCEVCTKTFHHPQALAQHQNAKGHHYSNYCDHCHRGFVQPESLAQHNLALHNWVCGDCAANFTTKEDLRRHMVSTAHCYCKICDRVFGSDKALKSHTRALHLHASEFRCCDCDRGFVNELALEQHLRDKVHHIERAEKPPFTCPKCERAFKTRSALNQHKASLAHKPISNLKCLAGKMGESGCQREFTSPSAMIQHLESGACPSRLNRQKLNEALETHDPDRIITQPEEDHHPDKLLKDGMEDLTLDTTDACSSSNQSVVLLTPSHSESSADSQSSLVASTTRCPLCPAGSRQFATLRSLQQHIDSPAHSPKLFRCPISLAPASSSSSSSKPLFRKSFTTLSGLAQHLESGACAGGKATLEKAAGYIEARLEDMGIKKVKLLI